MESTTSINAAPRGSHARRLGRSHNLHSSSLHSGGGHLCNSCFDTHFETRLRSLGTVLCNFASQHPQRERGKGQHVLGCFFGTLESQINSESSDWTYEGVQKLLITQGEKKQTQTCTTPRTRLLLLMRVCLVVCRGGGGGVRVPTHTPPLLRPLTTVISKNDPTINKDTGATWRPKRNPHQHQDRAGGPASKACLGCSSRTLHAAHSKSLCQSIGAACPTLSSEARRWEVLRRRCCTPSPDPPPPPPARYLCPPEDIELQGPEQPA